MPHIDYFFSTFSPFTYLAGTRLEEIATRHGASIAYKPFDLFAAFARTGGAPPKERHPARLDLRAQELRRQAKKSGLPIDLDPPFRAVNPAPSSYALVAAIAAGGGDLGKLVHGLTGAVWAETRDIGEDAVIRDCLAAAGFDPGLADSGLLQGAEAYTANTEEAVSRGVFGAPFYITDTDERFWGQDKLGDLDAHLAGDL
ncbi:MAG: 2-hydroxychromene-2-carboxylate isomerase [Rhodobacteraceae bacterium]|nr:2-hydroxychromene-2-carboxylate isomerase [Paracoccaceae bacterium]